MNERTHIDLFTGIGGFALAARANGVRTIAMCECDKRCQEFLSKAWPGVPIHDDVRTFTLDISAEARPNRTQQQSETEARNQTRLRLPSARPQSVYLLTAGVPCQPASRAGKQRGASDDRWLWPHALRVLAQIRPTWALFENPPGIGDVGLAGILSEVARIGYERQVLDIPACAVGAPHRRARYWIFCRRMDDSAPPRRGQISAETENRRRAGQPERAACELAPTPQRGQREHGSTPRNTRHADQCGQVGLGNTENSAGRSGLGKDEPARERWRRPCDAMQRDNPWSSYVWLPCADGKVRRAPDDSFCLVDGLHRSVLGALGNSIVPQVATQIIAAMIQAEAVTA